MLPALSLVLWFPSLTGNPWLGLLAGAFAGGLFGLLHALISIKGKADQIISGMGSIFYRMGSQVSFCSVCLECAAILRTSPNFRLSRVVLDVPFFSDLLFPLSPLHILLVFVVLLTIYVFYQTSFGLRLRACGEDPAVVRSSGVPVNFYRYTAVILSGIFAGLGGVQLSLCDVRSVQCGDDQWPGDSSLWRC